MNFVWLHLEDAATEVLVNLSQVVFMFYDPDYPGCTVLRTSEGANIIVTETIAEILRLIRREKL